MNIDRLNLLFKSRNNIRLERNTVVIHDIPSDCVTVKVLSLFIRFLERCTDLNL